MKNYLNLQAFVGNPNRSFSRCSAVALVVLLFLAPMVSLGNVITLKKKNSTLESIVLELEKQSGNNFVYNSSKVNMNQKLSVSANEKEFEEVLNDIENKSSVSFTSIGKKVIITSANPSLSSASVTQQKGKIVGVIIDAETGDPLPGASIVIEGTTSGAVSSFDGTFEMNQSVGDKTFVVTFIGYNNKTINGTVGSNRTLNLGTLELEPNNVGIDEVQVLASFVTDRKTPVSISNIKPEFIETRLGNQEFPEILKSTPSVYATKTGGGFGDSRVTLRGFSSENVGVLINGVPVNGMENGKVYWSNWAGLSDVTKATQVQRGLGASKVALSSTGGTINVLTRSSDAKRGGTIYAGVGNNGELKQTVSLSTGLLDNGWSVTFLGGHNDGSKYVVGTEFEAWTYFLNVTKVINDEHTLSFTGFGAPQWHNQRGSLHHIDYFRTHKDGIRANSEKGIRHGESYNGSYGYNEYHKPQLSLNHYWTINETTRLSTSAYASIAKGGGRRVYGDEKDRLRFPYEGTDFADYAFLTSNGEFDFDAAERYNAEQPNGSQVVQTMSTNSHDWYGFLSSLNKDIGNLSITAGLDGRYYKGYHFEEIDDLLGGDYFLFQQSNEDKANKKYIGDKVNYHNVGEVLWGGVFGQAEYSMDQFSVFLSASVTEQAYRRSDYFNYEKGNEKSEWVNFTPWSLKGGVNYNIDSRHNIFANGGYFTRAPFFSTVFLNYLNDVNKYWKYEKVYTGEVGYGFRGRNVSANITGFYTIWDDKGTAKSNGQGGTYQFFGINALHKGIEFSSNLSLTDNFSINLMGSYGDYTYKNDAVFVEYDENQEIVVGNDGSTSQVAYIDGVHVGNSAQFVANLGLNYKVFNDISLTADATYAGNNYADFDADERTIAANSGAETWEIPEYALIDLGVKWSFKLGEFDASLYGKVNNVFNEEYVADAKEGYNRDAATSFVYYGFGTTWSSGLKIKF